MNLKKLVRKMVPDQAVKQIEDTYRKSRGTFWQARYGYPARNLNVIAVTGTNGKTTTASYINSVLRAAGLKTAVYTTAFYEIAGEQVPNHTHMTVTSQRSVQSFFAKAKRAKVDYVVLEVTSHALDQARIAGVKVGVAVMTNLTQDHLDYHGTMERYASAKSRLFTDYNAKHAVLNTDDQWFDFFMSKTMQPTITYGQRKDASLNLKNYSLTPTGSTFKVQYKSHQLSMTTQLVGLFNIYNALAAASVGLALELDPEQIKLGIASLAAVPGRMEQIDEGQDFDVIVDFAYTPDALQNVLSTLKEVTKGKVSIVFGATGDRDATKRPAMGKVVGELADRIYLTDDETYTEDPATIRDAVYSGIKQAKAQSKTQVIDDRLEAIKAAFKEAKKGDVVLLTGIGHENYRNMGGKKVEWDERLVARQELK